MSNNVIPPISAAQIINASSAADFSASPYGSTSMPLSDEKVKQEFLAIFYKELLKKAFKAPNFGGNNDKNSLTTLYASDLMINKLAMQLAASKGYASDDIMPLPAKDRKGE